jgi:hypothetical protein
MKKLYLYIIIIVLSCSNCQNDKQPIQFRNINLLNKNLQPFDKDFEYALKFLSENEKMLSKVLGVETQQKIEILATVFPEMIRWNQFQDLVELSADKTLYVNGGKELGDFSVGYFQMKPSFIEDLENYISKNDSLNQLNQIVLNLKSEKENRRERMQRLEDFEWQLKYAYAYWLVANDKFREIKFQDQEAKIRFFATAYNVGFQKSIEVIRKWEVKKAFPYGVNYTETQNAYSDFSIEFFNNYHTYFNN